MDEEEVAPFKAFCNRCGWTSDAETEEDASAYLGLHNLLTPNCHV